MLAPRPEHVRQGPQREFPIGEFAGGFPAPQGAHERSAGLGRGSRKLDGVGSGHGAADGFALGRWVGDHLVCHRMLLAATRPWYIGWQRCVMLAPSRWKLASATRK